MGIPSTSSTTSAEPEAILEGDAVFAGAERGYESLVEAVELCALELKGCGLQTLANGRVSLELMSENRDSCDRARQTRFELLTNGQ
jgi:hypothetical protein